MTGAELTRAVQSLPLAMRTRRNLGASLPFGYWKRRRMAVALLMLTHIPVIAWAATRAPVVSVALSAGFFAWMWTLARTRALRGWSVRLPAEVIADLLRVLLLVGAPAAALAWLAGEPIWLPVLLQGFTFAALAGQALFFRGKPASWVRILGSPSNLGAAVGTFDQCLDLLGHAGCRFAPFRADRPEIDAWERRIRAWVERGETVLVLEAQLRDLALRLRSCGDVIIGDDCLLFASMARPAGPAMNMILDWLNRAIAFAATLTLWPLALLMAALIKLDDGGPVFFAQERVGLNGAIFTVYKFRTMRTDADKYGQSPRGDFDPRVTRVGRWMRRLSLDEFPQLVNVLLGQMRLVGPRPEMPFIVEKYDQRQRQRLLVKPGVTGLWQVSPHRNDPIHEHIEYDLAYIAHRGPIIDLALIIATLGLANRSGA
ncbi:MAG: sugar transferase [Phycisphaerales bacterium]|nr:sugar transferase [Phycisphaerales bacterium]